MEPVASFFFSAKSGETGDGDFYAGGSQGVAYGKYWKNKLVDPHAFRTQSLCKEYLIEEAQEAGQKTGDGKDQGSF